jgi:hypothetical protein
MANISDKTSEVNATEQLHDSIPVTNWISQINAGGTVYDIATHHNIIFKDGSSDTVGTKWNGLSDLEVVIPSIKDIVQSPIEFAGTVGSNGQVTWNASHTDGPKEGYLVFVTADCTFADLACEAGDMAIYDGTKWNVVSGENQVNLCGNADSNDPNKYTVAIGAAKDVLTVEGKTLALTLDYADLNTHLNVEKENIDVDVAFGDLKVGEKYVKLTKGADQSVTIGEKKTIREATGLTNGTVTLTNAKDLVTGIKFGEFNAGTLPSFTPNSDKTLNVSGGSLNYGDGSHFVKSVSLGNISLVDADASDTSKITALTGITSGAGAEFLNGVHATLANETADITIAGYATPTKSNVEFVEGIKGNINPVTAVTGGEFKLKAGNDLATGFTTESSSGEVISSIEVKPVSNASVLNTATVTDHVLSFGTTDVVSDITVDKKYKSLTKTGFEQTKLEVTTTEFVKSGFTNVEDVKYTFDRGNETVYSPVSGSWKISADALNVETGSYTFNSNSLSTTIPAGWFVASATEGTLPSLGKSEITKTVTITGTVDTTLSYENVDINVLKSNDITVSGEYTLGDATTAGDNTVLVGAAGDLATVGDATVTIKNFITNVEIE